MNVREQVDMDYARARRRALVGRLAAWARRRCAGLWGFDEARRERKADNPSDFRQRRFEPVF
jgi:hypothetical protein